MLETEKKKNRGGRPKGSTSRANGTGLLKVMIHKASKEMREGKTGPDGIMQLIEAMFERAIGTTALRETAGGTKRLYAVPPDLQAAKLLLEYGFGKPKESLEIEEANKDPMAKMPFMIIVPPSANEKGGPW